MPNPCQTLAQLSSELGCPTPQPATLIKPLFTNEPEGGRIVRNTTWDTTLRWPSIARQGGRIELAPDPALRLVFTPGMYRDTAPAVVWSGLGKFKGVYAGWRQRMSPNWTSSPAGAGKIAFFFLTAGGQLYINTHGTTSPHVVSVNTEYGPYGQKFWLPNKSTSPLTALTYGSWNQIEVDLIPSTAAGVADGRLRVWVNGELNHDHKLIVPPVGWEEFQFSPTRQLPPPDEQYLDISHTRISVR